MAFLDNLQAPLLVAISFVVAFVVHGRIQRRSTLPGPFRWPIIGNALSLPSVYHWLTLSKMTETYGERANLSAETKSNQYLAGI